jgi:hypothetical protein
LASSSAVLTMIVPFTVYPPFPWLLSWADAA